MPPEPRDHWSRLDIIARTIGAILLPIVLLIVSNSYKNEQRDADALRYNADRLTTIVRSLASDNDRERRVALSALEGLIRARQVPSESVRSVLDDFVDNGSPEEVDLASQIIARNYPADRNAKRLRVRPPVSISIGDEKQRRRAEEARRNLESEGFDVVSIDKITTPPSETSQVRYFHEREKGEAKRIAEVLDRTGIRNAKEVYFGGYDRSTPQREYEVRFSAIALEN